MKATFIRHGESTGNAGIASHDHELLELTNKGWQQARKLAASWNEIPALIVTSPYLRAQQTAQPTIERFPGVPVEIWPIQEFTYLEPGRWNGTLKVERDPHIEAYWQAVQPDYQDGKGAESFANLLRRAETTLEKLQRLGSEGPVFLFTHGQFMQAVRHTVMFPEWTDKQKMEHFWPFAKHSPVLNGQKIEVELGSTGWQLTARCVTK
ncbi:MAG: histidine phosphatase family protein [Granulicella sp.]